MHVPIQAPVAIGFDWKRAGAGEQAEAETVTVSGLDVAAPAAAARTSAETMTNATATALTGFSPSSVDRLAVLVGKSSRNDEA